MGSILIRALGFNTRALIKFPYIRLDNNTKAVTMVNVTCTVMLFCYIIGMGTNLAKIICVPFTLRNIPSH